MATLPAQPEWVGSSKVLTEYDPFAEQTINVAAGRYYAEGWSRLRDDA